jgi:hypothetical protein
MNARRRLPAAAVLLLLGSGCAVAPEAPPHGLPDPAAVRAQLLRHETPPRSLRGLAALKVSGAAGSASATQAVVLALPDRARLETLGPLGTAALVVVLRGEVLLVHSLLEGTFASGAASPETLGRLTQVPLPPGVLLRLLAGLPPLAVPERDPRLVIESRGDGVRVESVAGPWWQRLWTRQAGVPVEAGELGGAAGVVLRFRFADHRPIDGTRFPFAIHLEAVTTGARLDLTFSSVRLDEPIDAELFTLAPPGDGRTRVIGLDGPSDPAGRGGRP